MAKVKTTVYVDEDVLRQIRVAAARRGRTVSELIEDALRRATLSGLIESIRSRSDLSEAEALELADSELHAMRRERDQPAA
jgi:plasmid stability protein